MRTSMVSWLVGSAAVVAGVSVFSCRGVDSDSLVDCEETRTCQSGTAGGDGGSDANVVVPAGCDLAKSPKDAPSCVDDGVGVFVSPTGSDGASGTKSAPVKSVAKGVEVAATRGLPRVYVCEGTYDANVELKSAVSVYGGLSCAWAYTGAKPKLAPPKGVALKVTKVTGAVVLEDLEVVGSADPSVPGDSAVAVFVSESTDVTLRNVAAKAGDASDGAPGLGSSNYASAAKDGTGATQGATAVSCTCADNSSSTGGKGGGLGAGGDPGSASPAVGDINSGLGGATCTAGTVGANGPSGAKAVAGQSVATLSASGFASGPLAPAGGNGLPAQGGGGGGGRTGVAAGGGGACGGCGGGGGKGGSTGGSTFALAAFNATVKLEGGTVVSSRAGLGGQGGAGQVGQAGSANGGVGACDGGPGGAGAGGSGGAGGAGGHSAPIAFSGTEPKVTGTTLTPGTAGKGGAGGTGGKGPGNAGPDGPAGVDGKSQPTLSL